jgi:hypothetical protein
LLSKRLLSHRPKIKAPRTVTTERRRLLQWCIDISVVEYKSFV